MKYIKDITDFIFLEDEPQKADIIFVPGSPAPEAAEHAARLWIQGYAPLVLPSGKHSITQDHFHGPQRKNSFYDGSYETEWDFLKDVLMKNGVDESCILQENRATYTYQNAIFSREATDRLSLKIERAILSCKSYHARRSLMYYETLYPDTHFFVCPIDVKGINRDNWYSTKEGIDQILGELKRCGEQFGTILKELFCT